MASVKDDWDILSSVHEILVEQNVLQTPENEPVIRFEHPDDLKVILLRPTTHSFAKKCETNSMILMINKDIVASTF